MRGAETVDHARHYSKLDGVSVGRKRRARCRDSGADPLFEFAVLISTLAGGGYGAQSLVPALQTYDAEFPQMAAANAEHFTLPEPEADGEAEIFSSEFKQWISATGDWASGFWEHASSGDIRLTRYLPMVAFGAGLVGLVFGLLAPRFTMISLTSVLGVAFMTSGSTALTQRFEPGL